MSLNLYIRTTLSTATIIIIIMTRERNDNNGNNGNNSNNIVRMITRWEERNGRHVDCEISPFIPLCVFDSWLSKKIDLITVTMLIIMIMTMTRIMITSKINRNHRPTIAILFFFFFFFNLLLLSLHGGLVKVCPFPHDIFHSVCPRNRRIIDSAV